MHISLRDRQFGQRLRQLSTRYNNRYDSHASAALLRMLFRSLANGSEDYLHLLFPSGTTFPENKHWRLSEAQGALDGAEYSACARGRRCGHIFKNGEATYSCRTCTADDTCVLCTRCFEASDHEGHQVYISTSGGSSGCCDCEDPEAWIRPVKCSIHTTLPTDTPATANDKDAPSALPYELQESIRTTISRALDFLCDTLSCCPEEMRPPTSEILIRQDEEKSRLIEKLYGGPDQREKEFALVLWNDEKHTVDEVAVQVARACRKARSFGLAKALEVDQIGRSVVFYSTDVEELLSRARILAQIKVTVTIRSSRDTFREEMCGTIIQWLSDIAGCSVGSDSHILMHVICEEMLKPWRIGSEAFNLEIAKNGVFDHSKSDETVGLARSHLVDPRVAETILRLRATVVFRDINLNRVDDEVLEADEDGVFQEADGEEADGEEADGEEADGEEADGEEADGEEADGEEADEVFRDEDDEMDVDDSFVHPGDGIATIDQNVADIGILDNTARPLSTATVPLQPHHPPGAANIDMPALVSEKDANKLFTKIPQTPKQRISQNSKTPPYWVKRRSTVIDDESQTLPLHEDLSRRIRIDHLILYDLRLWKQFRTNLKHLYISTVVTIPTFKRILSLRFAALYTHLAQLYLVADREPDHSIINLSLQMLTTPSITAEVVERGNFLTRLLAILYTFLTKRQVGNPEDVDMTAIMAFEAGVMTNRRIYHFFSDMKYLLDAPYVMDRVRTEQEYLLQFLDFAKLYQGICPNVRAVGEHIEYESDSWITASVIVRDVTRMSRQFCESFTWTRSQDPASICRAIRQTAKITLINSLGLERARFTQSELKQETQFKQLSFNNRDSPKIEESEVFTVVDFEIEKNSLSFHHALHYTLSWLIDCGKSMSKDQLQNLLSFTSQQLQTSETRFSTDSQIARLSAQEYLLGLFDIPLRVCAWLAQMKAGMWVRNGITLRHQMGTYRGVGQRDVSHQRDLFLLQVAFTVCNPASFLAAVIDRFGMSDWMRGEFVIRQGYEDHQLVDMAEEFVHLLIILLSDRTLLIPNEEDPTPEVSSAKRDIIQVLCFKPLTYSELTARLSDKVQELGNFHQILREVAVYRAPEGLADSGLLQLRSEFFKEIDPYSAYYSKSQREEAENIHRKYITEQTGSLLEDVFYVPALQVIKSGVFVEFGEFTQTPLFMQTIYYCLRYVLLADDCTPQILSGRPEGFLHTVLHLALIAVLEERPDVAAPRPPLMSFTSLSIHGNAGLGHGNQSTVLQQLFMLLKVDKYQSSKYRIRFLLRHFQNSQQAAFEAALMKHKLSHEWFTLMGTSQIAAADDVALKKKQAMERQAKVMADFAMQQKKFLQNQPIEWGIDEDDESDDAMTDANESNVWAFPSGTCIFCQEGTKDQQLYGTLGYLAKSKMFRLTDLKDADYVAEVCAIPSNLDQSADHIRPFGVAGQNVQQTEKANGNGKVVMTERKALGKGFPISQHEQGPVVTGCGHLMHYSCFQTYDEATTRRHQYQVARMHPEDIKLKEFVCPLCKALGNVFLPVVWRAKPLLDMPICGLNSFTEWLNIYRRSRHPVENLRDLSGQIIGDSPNQLPELFLQQYATSAFNSQLASALDMEVRHPAKNNIGSSLSSSTRFRFPAFLRFDQRGATTREDGFSDLPPRSSLMSELEKAYQRIGDTMRLNGLSSKLPTNATTGELSHADVLAKALGYSVAAAELGQRGFETSGSSFIDSIPEQTVTHLKVLSETVSSYVALTGLHSWTRSSPKFSDILRTQARQLFGWDETIDDTLSSGITPLFSEDLFGFYAESTVFMGSTFEPETHHVLQLCYIAEVVKVVVAVLFEPTATWDYAHRDSEELYQCTNEQSHQFSAFVEGILAQCQQAAANGGLDMPRLLMDFNPNTRYRFDKLLQKLVSKYILVFLRKSVLLLHVRYGIKTTINPPDLKLDPEQSTPVPEILRLSRILALPSLENVIELFLSPHGHSNLLQSLTLLWIRSWSMASRRQNSSTTKVGAVIHTSLQLTHPSIYELVALPYAHDSLNAEALSRRCPSTGGELTDPSICLLCGDFVCSQSRCCTVLDPVTHRREGGCFQHRKRCGGSIGMFLNIRKCTVLCLYQDRGSFFPAPYLDRHGEVDMGLRRKNQLFLNQRRYNKIFRDMWLNHQVPSAVARKLEAEINTGGWGTI